MPAAPKIKFTKLADLVPDPNNARTHSADQVAIIAESIRRFGWTNPILIDDLIRAGHGRCMAAAQLYEGGEKIYLAPGEANGGVAIPHGTVPSIDCTGWSEDDRRAYTLADNQIPEQAGWDYAVLQAELDALAAADFNVAMIGFDTSALEAIAAAVPAPSGGGGGATPPGQFPEFGSDIKTEHECPKCGYKWSGKAS